ncbi:DUF1648 domain-containing protein [Alicyclobacillus macrosporangiidus]|uniref:DUF1648 domain-containing protein n=1 Tax=Alicyclobacillus macrosporangiidus TaxID=392015 RepID=UPI00049821B1|nr:DUF5808 domain-containing protein [Alicyclobacillus macrosporangiidus]
MKLTALLPAHFISLVVILVFVVVEALLPAVVPKTLPFGVRVPLAHANHPAVASATRRFYRRLAVIAVLSIAIDLAALLLPATAAFLSGQAVVVLAAVACYANYYAAHRDLRRVKAAEDWFAGTVQVVAADTQPRRAPSLWWAVPSLAIFAAIVAIGIWRYPALPDRFPTHFGIDGTPNQWSTKSIGSAFGILIPNALFIAICLFAHLALYATRVDVDPQDPRTSVAEQLRQRRVWIAASWWSCAFAQAGLGLAALLLWGLLGGASGWSVLVIPTVILVGTIAPWIAATARSARARRNGAADAHQAGTAPFAHVDDDRHWIGGALYYNPADPAWMVPKRFGIGWTLNFARPAAWLVLLAILLVAALPGIIAVLSRR